MPGPMSLWGMDMPGLTSLGGEWICTGEGGEYVRGLVYQRVGGGHEYVSTTNAETRKCYWIRALK